ncbi:hypothetical protein FB451DRAFT_1362647 [Mycena latifolia]|nr:hypothetical protein FB451DRAFT_1362647 [Mycena latifolia]
MASIAPPPPTPGEVEELLLLVKDAKTTSYFAVAALTLLVYDHLVSLDHEIEFVWKRHKSLASCIYLWNRYWTLIITWYFPNSLDSASLMDPWQYQCKRGSTRNHFGQGLRHLHSVRRRFVYSHRGHCRYYSAYESLDTLRKVASLIVYSGAYNVRGDRHNVLHSCIDHYPREPYVHIGPILPGCYSATVPKYLTWYPVPSLIVTFAMFLMTVYHCTTLLGPRFASRTTMPIVNLFLRDGIYWFFAVVAVNPPQIIIWAVARPTLAEVLIVPSIVVYSLIGSRVLLNIMEIMARRVSRHDVSSRYT